MTLHDDIVAMGQRALAASRQLALLSARRKNGILQSMADQLISDSPRIQQENAANMEAGRQAGLSSALLDRLQLTSARIEAMAQGLREVAALPDPVGRVIRRWTRPSGGVRPSGLQIVKRRVPIGVIGIIYESRPNVTADAAALCFKTSNAVILRGGKEATRSNSAIVQAMTTGGARKGLPADAIQFIQTHDHEAIRELVQLEGLVDLVIPRGGEALIRAVMEQTKVPVIKHYKGVCHVFVDESADPDMALAIIENAKCQRPGVCNAIEKVLIHEAIAGSFLPRMVERLQARGVELRGDEAARRIVATIKATTEEDWTAEYLGLILTIGIVPSAKAAVEHINRYSSHHSDAIIAASATAQKIFTDEVDSACVYVNASTRFTDGREFGMGAEIGISTDKLHARGPMGLEELTTYKYVIHGTGQVRK
ncbi:MAG: glutamate-5-semialdehyde dehydrogenase [Kiritimatiellae bacterium]|nr:glutamate-5-semialdehyde dehydrogenase [Kiritimatiellia bacterium]